MNTIQVTNINDPNLEKFISNIKSIKDLVNEVLVRFDTNPKLYLKIDFFKLLQIVVYLYLKLKDTYTKEEIDELLELYLKDAPTDGKIYGRKDGSWEEVSVSGGSVTDVKVDGSSVVTDGVANINGLAKKEDVEALDKSTVSINDITVEPSENNIVITVYSPDKSESKLVVLPIASLEAAGLMSAADKLSLNTVVSAVATLEEKKQDKLIAGENITISENNVISSRHDFVYYYLLDQGNTPFGNVHFPAEFIYGSKQNTNVAYPSSHHIDCLADNGNGYRFDCFYHINNYSELYSIVSLSDNPGKFTFKGLCGKVGNTWKLLDYTLEIVNEIDGYNANQFKDVIINAFYGLIEDLLDTKVDKEEGKGLSTNDYTTEEKEKLAGIEDGALKNQEVEQVLTEGVTIARIGDIEIYAPSQGSGNVTDVKVDNESVVDSLGVANITLEDRLYTDGSNYEGDLILVTPDLSVTWTINGKTYTDKNLTLEAGTSVDFSGVITLPVVSTGYKAPTSISGSFGTDIKTWPKTITVSGLTSNTSYYETYSAPKSGLIVVNNKVQKASGNDTTSASASITFYNKFFYGSVDLLPTGSEEVRDQLASSWMNSSTKTLNSVLFDKTLYCIVVPGDNASVTNAVTANFEDITEYFLSQSIIVRDAGDIETNYTLLYFDSAVPLNTTVTITFKK